MTVPPDFAGALIFTAMLYDARRTISSSAERMGSPLVARDSRPSVRSLDLYYCVERVTQIKLLGIVMSAYTQI